MKKVDTDIIFYAFRYALGRHTGAVGQVVDYIIKNWKDIPEKDKVQMKEEILNFNPIWGEFSQKEEWAKILNKRI